MCGVGVGAGGTATPAGEYFFINNEEYRYRREEQEVHDPSLHPLSKDGDFEDLFAQRTQRARCPRSTGATIPRKEGESSSQEANADQEITKMITIEAEGA